MPIGDIIGGATAASGASVDTVESSQSSGALSGRAEAGDVFKNWLNDRTPGGISWSLNYRFIVTILSALSTLVTLSSWVT